jgi:hypothetical protein
VLSAEAGPRCAGRILAISSKSSEQVFIGALGNQLKIVNAIGTKPALELRTFDEGLTKIKQDVFRIPEMSDDCGYQHEVMRGIEQALIVTTTVYDGKEKCKRRQIVTIIDKRDRLVWSTPVNFEFYLPEADEFGNIYFNNGAFKLSRDGRLDHEHSKKYENLKNSQARDTANPYTNFSQKIGKSSDGRLLAPKKMLAKLIEARGYKQIRKLPVEFKATFEKDIFVTSVGVDLEQGITDSMFGPDGHLLIVGKFALEKNGEIYMSFVDLGPP